VGEAEDMHNPQQHERSCVDSIQDPQRLDTYKLNRIPESLRSLPQWMGTRFEVQPDGRLDKPPYQVGKGKGIIKADKTNPANWATFDEALTAYERGEVDAVGFVFTEGDPFFGADGDDVIDRDTGEINPNAAEVIHALNSYTEVSCSGTGIRIVAVGKKPEYARCKSKKLGFRLELYDAVRFMVMTGNRIGRNDDVEVRQQ
jgi:putative DNA primase/helicase